MDQGQPKKFTLIPTDLTKVRVSSPSLTPNEKSVSAFPEFEAPLQRRGEKYITQLLESKIKESPFHNKTNPFYAQKNIFNKERLTINVINQKKELKNFYTTFGNSASNQNELLPLNQEDKRVRNMNAESLNRKMNGSQLRKLLKDALIYLSKLKLNIFEISEHVVFSYKPFQKEYSNEFIFACKLGKYNDALKYLMLNKFLVYDFDYLYMTGLHWACKRGHLRIVTELIKYGADLEAKDMIGRNPLYFAILGNFNDIVKLLLFHEAEPFSSSGIDLKQACANNPDAEIILKRARKVQIALKMAQPKMRKQIWERQKYLILGAKNENLYLYD